MIIFKNKYTFYININFIIIFLEALFFYSCSLKNEKNDDNVISNEWLTYYTSEFEARNNINFKSNKLLNEEEKKREAFFNNDISKKIPEENRETARKEFENIFKMCDEKLVTIKYKFEERRNNIFDKYEEMKKLGAYTKESEKNQIDEITQSNLELEIENKNIILITDQKWSEFVEKYSIKPI